MNIQSPAPRPEAGTLPLGKCFAKTFIRDGICRFGRTVEEHCRIVGAVAEELLARMPDCVRALFPRNAHLPALLHDTGKVWPNFLHLLYRIQRLTPPAEVRGSDVEANRGHGHAAVSRAALRDIRAPERVCEVVGQHHGMRTERLVGTSERCGGRAWQRQRRELVRRLAGKHPQWPDMADAVTFRLVCGLTTVSDWIGSGHQFDEPARDWWPLVRTAVDEAGFVPFSVIRSLGFEEIFSFAPRPGQKLLYEAVTEPGVYVLEAPMGAGKTEAALYAGYRQLERGQSSGVYFALPTRLTSNRIHARVNRFLDRILATPTEALLLHGKADLDRFLERQTLGGDASPSGSWFEKGRRGILAPFAVGTIDQVLMAALNVRHSAVRAFGLAGKAVILDEVHSYDTYTGTILDFLVRLLRRLGCTVIILSATLTAKRRAALIGRPTASAAYPLVTASPSSSPEDEPAAETALADAADQAGDREILIGHPSADAALAEALRRAGRGERVLWIENTVAEAQRVYGRLAARAASLERRVEVGLLHSRFTPGDRKRIEDVWTARFASKAEGRGRTGAILVGTQVVEQSLDLDADFLVTAFCPTDMLLQRLGRLWRHGDTVRPQGARREAWLVHPAQDEALAAPKEAFGSTGCVYAPYVLCRSLELWSGMEEVRLPKDIRGLVEATYADRTESSASALDAKRRLMKERNALHHLALHGLSTDGSTRPEETVQTRFGGREQVDVLLLRSWDPATRLLVLADGRQVSLHDRPAWSDRKKAAVWISMCIVRVDKAAAPICERPDWLRRWFDIERLYAVIVRDDTMLCNINGNDFENGKFSYNSRTGYRKIK